MPDVFSKAKRSELMSRVRSHGNKTTELRLIDIFKEQRMVGWRRKQKLPGKPDFVFRKTRLCVFVDGCFWHGCPKHGSWPKQNEEFWSAKINRTKVRDRLATRELRHRGWTVIRIWEHSLKKPGPAISRLRKALVASPQQLRTAKEKVRRANLSSPSRG